MALRFPKANVESQPGLTLTHCGRSFLSHKGLFGGEHRGAFWLHLHRIPPARPGLSRTDSADGLGKDDEIAGGPLPSRSLLRPRVAPIATTGANGSDFRSWHCGPDHLTSQCPMIQYSGLLAFGRPGVATRCGHWNPCTGMFSLGAWQGVRHGCADVPACAKFSPSGHRLLDRLLAMLVLLYNAALEERIHAWRMSGRSISLYDRFGSLTAIQKQDPEWREIPVLVARSALVRLDRVMQGFSSRVRSGKKPGFPRFRARSRYRSFSVDHPKSARCALRIRDEGRRGELRGKALPRIRFAIRRSLPPLERSWGLRVIRKARRVEVQPLLEPVLPAVRTDTPDPPVGLDAGIRSFATLSDGGRVERQRKPAVRNALRRIQRAVSRSRRGSKSRGKKRAALARAHEREAVSGRQELHRLADRIIRVCDLIAAEALQIRNMTRRGTNKRGVNRAIAEQGWGAFFDGLKCRAGRAGSPFVEVPPAGTSQDCSRSGI